AVCGESTDDSRQTTGEGTPVDHRQSTVDSVLDGILSLVEMSLLRQVGGPLDEQPRYRMLETIREVGLERLAGRGGGGPRGAGAGRAGWGGRTRPTSGPSRSRATRESLLPGTSASWPAWTPSMTTCARRWPGRRRPATPNSVCAWLGP